jgi:hypothetical protein
VGPGSLARPAALLNLFSVRYWDRPSRTEFRQFRDQGPSDGLSDAGREQILFLGERDVVPDPGTATTACMAVAHTLPSALITQMVMISDPRRSHSRKRIRMNAGETAGFETGQKTETIHAGSALSKNGGK